MIGKGNAAHDTYFKCERSKTEVFIAQQRFFLCDKKNLSPQKNFKKSSLAIVKFSMAIKNLLPAINYSPAIAKKLLAINVQFFCREK